MNTATWIIVVAAAVTITVVLIVVIIDLKIETIKIILIIKKTKHRKVIWFKPVFYKLPNINIGKYFLFFSQPLYSETKQPYWGGLWVRETGPNFTNQVEIY